MGKVWTVKEVTELENHPSYLKRYPIGDGLTLAVHPSGRMTWERSYTQEGKLRWVSFGVHRPTTDRKYTTEVKARAMNEEFMDKRAEGIMEQRVESTYTLEEVVSKYLATIKHPSTRVSYGSVLALLKELYPKTWRFLTDDIIEEVIFKRLEAGEVSLVAARECFFAIRRVSRFSLVGRNKLPKVVIFEGRKFNDLQLGSLKVSNHPAITNELGFRDLYKIIKEDWNKNHKTSVAAIIVIAHFPKRVSEITNMKWEHIDFQQKVIRFPSEYEKVKSWKIDYPMSDFVFSFLSKLYEYRISNDYVFSVRMNKPLTPQAVRSALSELSEKKHSPNGFRASFKTIGEHILKYNIFDMELTLGHKAKDPYKGAYSRITDITNINERRELANQWSNWLESP